MRDSTGGIIPRGIYTPGRKFREKQILTVVVDVSGSMILKPEELESAFGVVEALQENISCISSVSMKTCLYPERMVKNSSHRMIIQRRISIKRRLEAIQTQKSGTTLFAPLFNRFMKGHRELLLIITDGYIYDMHSLRSTRRQYGYCRPVEWSRLHRPSKGGYDEDMTPASQGNHIQ